MRGLQVTGPDRNCEIQPIFSTAITTNNMLSVSTTAAATATVSGEPVVASDTTAAPRTGAVEEPRPGVTERDVLNRAKTTSPAAGA